MARASLLSTLLVHSLVIVACGGSSSTGGQTGDAGRDGHTSGSCAGTAPSCFGGNSSSCCGQDPAGPATCESGKWMCGSAEAPGCNGKSCVLEGDSGPDSSVSCSGSAPQCFGDDSTSCCGQDPSGTATCEGGAWKCGSVDAPGCNGKTCTTGGDAGPDSGGIKGADPGMCTPACKSPMACCNEPTHEPDASSIWECVT